MRKPTHRLKPLAALAITAIAVVSFTACGGRSHDVAPGGVADVSNKPIPKTDFDHWLNVVVATQQAPGSKTKPKVPKPGSAQYEQLTRQVMQFLVSSQWIDGEARERGITASSAEVKRQFDQTKNQSFPNNKAYQQFLKRTGQSQDDILFRVRLDVLANKLRQDVTKDVANISDSAIEDYYKKNEQQFSQPERRDLQMVETKTEDQANQALSRLQKGEKFPKVAKDVSIDQATKQQGGKMLGVVKGQQEKSLDGAIFSAVKGKLAGPIKTTKGYVILQVTKVTPASKQSLDQSKEGIRQLLVSQNQQQALDAFTTKFQTKWRSRTDCVKAYATPECSNGPPQQTQAGLAGVGGNQPPARTGAGSAPAYGGAQAATPTTGIPGAPAAAPTGAPAQQGNGTAPAYQSGPAAAPQVPQGAQQVPQQQGSQGAPPPSQGGSPGGQ